jgi:hypothetical protein
MKHVLERGDTVQVTMPKPYIKYKIISSSRSWDICYESVNGRTRCSFYWKKWFYIWYMALAWWLVPCLPFPGLPHIYFLFTVRLTNERVGVFIARRSVQHLVYLIQHLAKDSVLCKTSWQFFFYFLYKMLYKKYI